MNERYIDAVNRAAKKSGWIPTSERLPDNAYHKGALCERVLVDLALYGVTEGWYNPDHNCWYALLWTMGDESDQIDMERGDIPTVQRFLRMAVVAWKPLEELERRGGDDEHKTRR